MELQAAHDALLANMPSGIEHDTAACPFCTAGDDGSDNDNSTGGGDTVTYTKEEFDAALAAELAPILEELNTLKSGQEAAAIDARIAELETTHAAAIADLQAQLDTAALESEKAKNDYAELVALLESAENAAVEAAIFAAVREERVSKVKEVASFSEEHVELNADRWAAMEADAFEAQLSDWSAIMSAGKSNEEGTSPSFATAMQASQEDRQGGSDTPDLRSVRAELMSASVVGVDLTTI